MTPLELLRITIDKFKETPNSSEIVDLLLKAELEVMRLEAEAGDQDMSPEKIAELLHLLQDKPDVLPSLIKIFESGDRDAIDSLVSTLRFHAKKAAKDTD
jgi:hypothetical protein